MCEHKYDCGCEKEICEDCQEIIEENNIPEEEWRDLNCEGEGCKLYYTYRNDNCNCDSRDCGYCNPEEAPAEEEDDELRCGCCGETEEENEDILEIITCAGCDNNYCDICEGCETFLEDWVDGELMKCKYWCVACYDVEEKRREEKNI